MGKLTEKWVNAFDEYFIARETGRSRFDLQPEPDTIDQRLNDALTNAILYAHQNGGEGQPLNQVMDNVGPGGQHHKTHNTYPEGLVDHYRYLHTMCKELNNIREQELKADLKERRRYLRYRIYTTVGIAGIVFSTAALSYYTGIPLPLSRGVVPMETPAPSLPKGPAVLPVPTVLTVPT